MVAELGRDVEPIASALVAYYPEADLDLIRRAYDYAVKSHDGQTRLSGEPYITHPLAVARIMTQLNGDTASVAAALLHDVLEDCDVTHDVLAAEFGAELADLVSGVTKLSRIQFSSRQEAQASSFRRLLFAMARDIRVVVIKLADRLHNMRTLSVFDEKKRRDIATETLQIFAPLAERLGIWRVKWELEDLCLREIDPEAYRMIEEKIARRRQERLADVENAVSILKPRFEAAGIQAEIYGRAKHFYSIYLKMLRQKLEFEEIYDLTALRVIVDTMPECYVALGLVHQAWAPMPDRFTDFIARPKSNHYRSIHTKVMGPRNEPLEVQIRTWDMHHICEYGVAAHWRYKAETAGHTEFDRRISWLRQLLDLGSDLRDANEFLHSLKEGLLRQEAFVFTPKGDLVELPAGSTPVDFAYRIHSEVGHRCVGARVNHRMVPLSTALQTGDIVEIVTQRGASPSLDWLHFVRTASARAKIRSHFRQVTFEENLERGRELVQQEARQRFGADWQDTVTADRLSAAAQELNYPSVDRLLAGVGFREVSAEAVLGKIDNAILKEQLQNLESIGLLAKHRPVRDGAVQILASGMDGLGFRLSRCCSPLPGDPIVGYVTRGRGLAIHRSNCHNARALMAKDAPRILPCEWVESGDEATHLGRIELEAIERVGLLKDITSIIADVGVTVNEANIHSTDGGRKASMDLVFTVSRAEQVNALVERFSQLSDILRVRRVPR